MWGVKGFYRPFWVGLGLTGYTAVILGSALVLIPIVGVAYQALSQGHPGVLVWCTLAPVAFILGVPSLNLVEALPWWLIAGVGWLLSRWFGPLHAWAGCCVLVTWYGAGLFKGAAMAALGWWLARSEKSYRAVLQANLLLLPGA